MAANTFRLRPFTANDLEEASALLTAAFDTPFYHYICPDAEERQRFLLSTFRVRLRSQINSPNVDILDCDHGRVIAGIAVWHRPGETEDPRETAERDAALAECSPSTRNRFNRFLHFMDDIERRELRLFPSPPWHLAPIGVLPSEQGKGAAGLLLHTRIARIDSEQGSVYIATQDEKNIPFYEHFGFTVMSHSEIPGSGMPHITMRYK